LYRRGRCEVVGCECEVTVEVGTFTVWTPGSAEAVADAAADLTVEGCLMTAAANCAKATGEERRGL